MWKAGDSPPIRNDAGEADDAATSFSSGRAARVSGLECGHAPSWLTLLPSINFLRLLLLAEGDTVSRRPVSSSGMAEKLKSTLHHKRGRDGRATDERK